ncbi:MAG: efflux RND transporter permease subunit [Myxococcota bacterium]
MIRAATDHPKVVFAVLALAVIAAGAQIPRAVVDTDPENMLPADQAERLFHHEVKDRFELYDMMVVGVVNEEHSEGVFNPESLGRIHDLTRAIEDIDGVIVRDIMSPATVDKIESEGLGTVSFSWLLPEKPESQEEATAVREAAQRMPMLQDTLISANGKAVALYVPIESKTESHRISQEIKDVFAGYEGDEQYFITGLPVAEDTFGVQMFTQMALSAPLAALVIFLIMWWFFRSVALITAPMIIAMSTVIIAMGALIGAGYTVHIMSSMIPIFLMPIAVVASVHVLSEISDRYQPGDDPREVIQKAMEKLFTPIFYTSLTTVAGFSSLIFAPIPPVRVFGVFVAGGVAVAFLLTVLFIPAYFVSLSEARLKKLSERNAEAEHASDRTLLGRLLPRVGGFAVRRSKLVVLATAAVVGLSVYGITLIQINDNPVRWFAEGHELRVADRVLNKHFAGTYPAYLVLEKDKTPDADEKLRAEIDALVKDHPKVASRWEELREQGEDESFADWTTRVIEQVDEASFAAEADADYEAWMAVMDKLEEGQLEAKYFQSPEALAYIDTLQEKLGASDKVGKTTSVVDIVKTVFRDLQDGEPEQYRIPPSSAAVAQSLLSYQSSHRPGQLWHFITPDKGTANIWVQLKSGDNQDMLAVVDHVDGVLADNPPPEGVDVRWAGMTYLNVVWQQEMVEGMLDSLLGAFVIVLFMMIFLFRSILFGLLSMIPLTVTILFIYGIIGLVGKEYDMPVAVLSAMTLGLSVDFAIHFLQRARRVKLRAGNCSWDEALPVMFHEPARAISRNAIVIAIGFLPLLAAPLVPYNTVGFFMAAIMATSGVMTLVLLPAAVHLLRKRLPDLRHDPEAEEEPGESDEARETATVTP